MNGETLLLAAVFAPTLGSLLLPLLGRVVPGVRNGVALALVLVALGCSVALIPSVYAGKVVTVSVPLGQALGFTLQADGLAVFVAIVSSLVSAIIVLYSTSYISHYSYQNEYYFMVVLFLGAMMGLVFAGHLLLLYIFWEKVFWLI